MTDRYRKSESPINLEGAWQQLGAIDPDELLRLRKSYLLLGQPLGGEVWSFGLWVAFGTHATTN